MAKKPLPTPVDLRQLLRYEPETGKLFWREAPLSLFADAGYPAAHRRALWNGKYAGKEALCYRDHAANYAYGTVFGTKVYAHRAIVAIDQGAWPPEVDHINGDRTDNRLSNLRAVTRPENAKNRPMQSRNKSGVIGVSWDKSSGKWAAEISEGGTRTRLGYFENIEDAKAARVRSEAMLGFHANHGRANNRVVRADG